MCPAQPDRLPQSVGQSGSAPRIGVPYRTLNEQLTNKRGSYDKYLEAIRLAGGEAVEIPLNLPKNELARLTESLDASVLSGGPADVDRQFYRAARNEKPAPPDAAPEQADFAVL